MGAEEYLPRQRLDLESLARAAAGCRGCDLYRHASQTVFGEGRRDASLFFIGEQPGDQEDLRGLPFVGPAGRLLDELLEEAGIQREQTYLTNVVKHFKWEPRGKKRLHQKPGAREVAACLPWPPFIPHPFFASAVVRNEPVSASYCWKICVWLRPIWPNKKREPP
ncbi:MAG: uracil-DNA glycosylase family protein [Vulcanimicrobiota bacterium]